MSNETIFREVDEELRGDRLRAFWKRFGPWIIGGAVAVVLLVGVNEGWTWWQNTNSARSSDQFYAALTLAEEGKVEEARTALNAVTAEASGGYPTLARFRQASLLSREGNTEAAVAAYDALSTSETNPRIRDLALVLAASLLVDNGDVAAVTQRVGGLAVEGNSMRNAAREAIGLTQYKAGDLNAALATFEQILNDPLSGSDIRNRVQIYSAQLISMGATGPADADAAEAAGEAAATGEAPAAAPAADALAESVGDAPAMDVTEPAAPEAAAPAAEAPAAAPAAEAPAAAPAAEAPAATAPAANSAAAEKGAADALAAIAAADAAPAAAAPAAAPATPAAAPAAPQTAAEKGAADAAAAVAAPATAAPAN